VSAPESKIELRVQGRGRQAVVFAVLDGDTEKALGRGDLADREHRAKLAQALCDEFAALDIEAARRAIDDLASRSLGSTSHAQRRSPTSTGEAQVSVPGSTLTDTCNAERLVRAHGERLRHCHPWKKWLFWDGTRWRPDDRGHVMGLSKRVTRALLAEAVGIEDVYVKQQTIEWAIKSEKAERRKAMVDLARSELGIPVSPSELDRDPFLLNCRNATLDLRTGEHRSHRPSDLITKLCPTNLDLAASCPKWTAFLERVLPDDEVRAYFQRYCGYCLTGDVSEQMILIAVGEGANGKSTAFRVIQEVLSKSYAIQISADMLTAKAQRSHPTELADLFGTRLAIGIETSKHQELDVPLIKQLTGGDRVRARRMREDFWEFDPTHKLVLVTNHLPRVPVDDYAMLRRLHRLVFEVTIPAAERDKKLLAEILGEREGVLAWMMDGYRMWRERGLDAPEPVQFPKPAQPPSPVDQFIKERLARRPGGRTNATALYAEFQRWCPESAVAAVSQTEFGSRLGSAGIGRRKSHGVYVYLDVELIAEPTGGGQLGTVGDPFSVERPACSHESVNPKTVPNHPQPSPSPLLEPGNAGFERPSAASETADSEWGAL